MNTLMRWEPFKEMEDIQNRLGTWLGHTSGRKDGGMEAVAVAEWAPLVDITEDEKEYVVKADLPDVKKEDVKVTVENGVLAISGERRFEQEETGKKYHRVERAYGSFLRSFALPEGTEAGKVIADFKDGVLKVHLPKSEIAKPTTVEIKVL